MNTMETFVQANEKGLFLLYSNAVVKQRGFIFTVSLRNQPTLQWGSHPSTPPKKPLSLYGPHTRLSFLWAFLVAKVAVKSRETQKCAWL